MNLTKRTIEKLYSAPINVKLYNGNFNCASVRIDNNKIGYELRVEDTHECLREFSTVKEPRTTFIVWDNPYRGLHCPLPDSLKELQKKLLDATAMSDEEASKLCSEMIEMMMDCYREMGWRE